MAAAPAEVAAAVNNALDDRKSAKLPYYYHGKKDTFTARQLIDKVEEIASVNATWNDQKKIVEIKNVSKTQPRPAGKDFCAFMEKKKNRRIKI